MRGTAGLAIASLLLLDGCSLALSEFTFGSSDAGAQDSGLDATTRPDDAGTDADAGEHDGGPGDSGMIDAAGMDACTPSTEVCNGVDDDCGGDVDEGSLADLGCIWSCEGFAGCDDPVQVVTGWDFTCTRMAGGSAACWGENLYGQVGDGSSATAPIGVPTFVVSTSGVGTLSGVSHLAAGWHHACARLDSGEAVCWGRNEDGQLGTGSALSRVVVPSEVLLAIGGLPLMRVEEVAAGIAHSCARASTGGVYCWGRNAEGQLGFDTGGADSSRARQVRDIDGSGDLLGVTRIAAGGNTTCARMTDSRVACWGWTPVGNEALPTLVPGIGGGGQLTGVADIVVGNRFACARLVTDELVCWGENADGQLGDGTTAPTRAAPDHVIDLTTSGHLADVAAVTAGIDHACASTSALSACWGDGFTGGLGNGMAGSAASSPRPVEVVEMSGSGSLGPSAVIAAGGGHSCSLSSGRLYCWGSGSHGEVGDGGFTNRSIPTEVLAP